MLQSNFKCDNQVFHATIIKFQEEGLFEDSLFWEMQENKIEDKNEKEVLNFS
jgi:hypothetical protein